jgi:hypothetical protein
MWLRGAGSDIVQLVAVLHLSCLEVPILFRVSRSPGEKFGVFGDTNDAARWAVKIASNRVYSEIVATV